MASVRHAEAFREALLRAGEAHEHGWQLHIPTSYDLSRHRLWLAPDSMGGAAVTPEGDLVSVFRHPRGSSISSILREAAEEATTLDCFDVNDFLPRMYRELGFHEVGRERFDPALAPRLWDPEKHGTPDVVFMSK